MNSFPERHKQQACSRRSLFPRNGFSGQVKRRVLSPRIHAVLSSLACVCVLYCGCRDLLCVICFWKDLHKPWATRINTSQFSIWIQNPEWREMGSRSTNKKGARKKEETAKRFPISTSWRFLVSLFVIYWDVRARRAHFAARVCSWIPERQFYDSCVCISSAAGIHTRYKVGSHLSVLHVAPRQELLLDATPRASAPNSSIKFACSAFFLNGTFSPREKKK